MSAPLNKSDFVFRLSTSQSYIGPDYDPTPLPALDAAAPSLGRRIGDKLAFVAGRVRTFVARRATMNDMAQMSDRELADIGLTRSDLPRVFDADFAADHARGRFSY
jgi:uncharacterized protein YjiS (DUF1127 family)